MPKNNPLRILFVVNPVSGGRSKADLETEIRDYFRTQGHETEWYELTGKDDHASIAYWIRDWKPDRVVAVGGDGTLKAVAEHLVHSPVSIGLLPAGSANGMARELGLPKDFRQCLDVITRGTEHEIDIIRLDGKEICLHLSDFGLNAQLVKYFEESDSRGQWGYAKEVFKVLWNKKQLSVEIKTDKETVFREAFMVVLANARMYGTGAMINPEGDLQDGIFEVVLMRRISFWELLKMLVRYRAFDPRKTEVLRTTTATIKIRSTAYFQVDGEFRGEIRKLQAEVVPKALRIMLPADAK